MKRFSIVIGEGGIRKTTEVVETASKARVMQYGCLAPIEGVEVVHRQLRAAAKYYNDLIALERCRRVVYRELRAQHVDTSDLSTTCERLAAELDALRTEIKNTRQRARSRVETAEKAASAKQVHGQLQQARARLKEAQQAAKENVALREAAQALDERAKVWAKALRAMTDCYWGSYLLAEASVKQARKATVDPSFRQARGRERSTREWRGPAEGRIGMQIQGGMTAAELLGAQDTRVRLVDAPASFQGRRTSARGMRRCVTKLLYIRVGSEARSPIWAVFPIITHRPIPQDARIKNITVSLRVEGMREKWTANITYTRETAAKPQRSGIVAIDLGWRLRDDGLRVAYWVDGQGRHGEMLMPASIRARLRKASGLREIQDSHFNNAVKVLIRWTETATLPAWLQRECETLGQWRSHARLRGLVLRWRDSRFPGDGEIFGLLVEWVRRSRHLSQYEDGTRGGALRARREVYRQFAARLAEDYGTVVIEKFALQKMKRLHTPEQEADAPRAQRAQLHASAPGELRQAVVQAAQREGRFVVAMSAAGTTSHCHECGGACVWDQAKDLWHRCEHCGAPWDQDRNAAVNLLRSYERSSLAQT